VKSLIGRRDFESRRPDHSFFGNPQLLLFSSSFLAT
jgi:hypothetical protein